MSQRRNRRAGVEDRWHKTIRDEHGNPQTVPSAAHGRGSRWRARYVSDDGRERAKAFARKVDAQTWLDRQVSDQVTGTWVDPDRAAVTFGAIAERWFETKANREPKTVAGYRSILDQLVLPRWEDVPLRDIRYDDLQVWVTRLSVDGSARFPGKGLSASRVRQTHQLIGAVLRFAVKGKYLPANPADGIDLPRLPETEKRFLTHEQLHRLAVASGRYRTLVLLLGYCGLRRGEATALRIRHVDLDGRRIHVRRSVTQVKGEGPVEGPTKTHRIRTVPIPAFVAKLLRSEVGDRGGDELVFPSPRDGRSYLTGGQIWYVFGPATAAVDGCAGMRIHDLRHTCASLSISAGANVKVVQRMLGHRSATLTLDTYGHLFPDDLAAVADAFDAAAADVLRTIPPSRVEPSGQNPA